MCSMVAYLRIQDRLLLSEFLVDPQVLSYPPDDCTFLYKFLLMQNSR